MTRMAHGLVLLLFLGGCGRSADKNSDKDKADVPDEIILYSIDFGDVDLEPDKDERDQRFQGYRVLGKVAPKDAATRREIFAALKKAMDESDGDTAKCFEPRHGLRVGGATPVDYVICFECYQMRSHSDKESRTIPITRKAEDVFNKHLQAAGVKLAPGPKERAR